MAHKPIHVPGGFPIVDLFSGEPTDDMLAFMNAIVSKLEEEMSDTIKLFPVTVLDETPVQLYTATALTKITSVAGYNRAAGVSTVLIYIVPAGGSATSSSLIYGDSIAATSAFSADEMEGAVLAVGDSIFASTDSAGSKLVNVTATGERETNE